MALSYAEVGGSRVEAGQIRARTYIITLDTDYPTGGWAIAAANVGLSSILFAGVVGQVGAAGAAATTGYVFSWDYLAKKLQSFDSGANAGDPLPETTAGDNDLDTRRVVVQFWGY